MENEENNKVHSSGNPDTKEEYEQAFRLFYDGLSDSEREYLVLYNASKIEDLDNYFSDSFGSGSNVAREKLHAFESNLTADQATTIKKSYGQLVNTNITENDNRIPMDILNSVVDSLNETKEKNAAKSAFKDFYEQLSQTDRQYIQLLNKVLREELDNMYVDYSVNKSYVEKEKYEQFIKDLDKTKIESLKSNYHTFVGTSLYPDKNTIHLTELPDILKEIEETIQLNQNKIIEETAAHELEETQTESSNNSTKEIQIDSKTNPFNYFNLKQPISSEFISDFNQVLSDTFDLMGQKEEGTVEYLTKAEVTELMEQHFAKMEELFTTVAASIDQLANPTIEEKNKRMATLVTKVKEQLTSLKEQLLKAMSTKKERALFHVKDKSDSLRIVVKNAVNKPILSLNNSMKKLSVAIDKNISLEEKANNSSLVSKEESPTNNKDQQVEVEATSEIKMMKFSLPAHGKNVDPLSSINEQIELSSVEPATTEGNDKTTDNISEPVKQKEESENEATNLMKKIEELSHSLNIKVNKNDMKLLEQQTEEVQQSVIQELQTMMKNKEEKSPELEPEIGLE